MRSVLIVRRGETPPAGAGPVPDSVWAAGADAHLEAVEKGVSTARCSLWTHDVPVLNGEILGYIGQFECTEERAGVEVLDAARGELAKLGAGRAVGPIDGNTWHRYRLVTWSSGEPPYFMEPTNPVAWPGVWERAGFAPLATYQSAVNEKLASTDGMLTRAAARARDAGLSVRQLDPSRFEEELRAIYDLSLAAFADNFLYSPIAWEEFAGMYLKLRRLIDPRLVLLSDDPRRPGQLAGFVLALPDLNEAQRQGQTRSLIIKTLAVHPSRRSCGLGSWLCAQAQCAAASMGLSRSVFALMHDENHSARIGDRYGRVFRRYTLFSRGLRP
jgi:GNAT superfamily N-acetyltransferase